MITKAIIQDVINAHKIRIRIPLYNKLDGVNGSTPNNELSIASVCTLPNIISDPHVGDIVFVSFEEDNIAKPVILGYLSSKADNKSLTNIKCDNLLVKGETCLTKETVIGEIEYENISQLKGLKDNINLKFQSIDKNISSLKSNIQSISQNINENTSNILQLQLDLGTLEYNTNLLEISISNLNSIITNDILNDMNPNSLGYKIKTGLSDLNTKIDDKIQISTQKPSVNNLKDGQLYLWVQ